MALCGSKCLRIPGLLLTAPLQNTPRRDKQEFDVLWLSEERDLTKVSPWHEQIRVFSQLII